FTIRLNWGKQRGRNSICRPAPLPHLVAPAAGDRPRHPVFRVSPLGPAVPRQYLPSLHALTLPDPSPLDKFTLDEFGAAAWARRLREGPVRSAALPRRTTLRLSKTGILQCQVEPVHSPDVRRMLAGLQPAHRLLAHAGGTG